MAAANTSKRISIEYNRWLKTEEESRFFTVNILDKDTMREWDIFLHGPPDSIYEGHKIKLHLTLTSEYPHKSPVIKFITKMFHPNIDHNGKLCLDILNRQWSPSMSIEKLLLSINSLLVAPNADDPLNSTAAVAYKSSDSDLYKNTVIKYITNTN
jgi:ubiquitin-protein ligase